jgi:hypothetical protein
LMFRNVSDILVYEEINDLKFWCHAGHKHVGVLVIYVLVNIVDLLNIWWFGLICWFRDLCYNCCVGLQCIWALGCNVSRLWAAMYLGCHVSRMWVAMYLAANRSGYKLWHHLPRQHHVASTLASRGTHVRPCGTHVSATSSPCGIHVIATGQPRRRHMEATSAPCGSHVSAAWQPRQCRVASTSSPRGSHVIATWHPRHRHVASMSSPRGSHVSNQLISISDVASQSMTITFDTDFGLQAGFNGLYTNLWRLENVMDNANLWRKR